MPGHYNRTDKHLKELRFNRPLSLLKAVTSRSSNILVRETTIMLRKVSQPFHWEVNYSSKYLLVRMIGQGWIIILSKFLWLL